MRKFFVSAGQVGEESILLTDQDDIKHITKVLRLSDGDSISISDAQAYEYETVIKSIGAEGICCVIHDKQRFLREPVLNITLFQGIPKHGKMESIIQKAVEIGVKEIIPVFTARTVVEDKGNFKKKIDRWEKISAEAAKQCRRGLIPHVRSAISFRDMVAEALQGGEAFDAVIFPYENEENITIKEVLRRLAGTRPKKAAVIIGPEGGFSHEEARLLTERGALSVTLGKTILRTETAGLVAASMMMYEWEI